MELHLIIVKNGIVNKWFIVVFTVILVNNAMSFNPLLTYTVRFKKVTMYPNITGNYTIDQYKDKQYINGHILLDTKEIVDKVVVIFDRCNAEGIDCEYFQSWTFTDICTKLKEKNQIWSQWYDSFDPQMQCPITRGRYHLRNGTLDVSHVLRWYADVTNYQWKVKQIFYAGDVFIGAYSLDALLFGYRKKLKSVINGLQLI